MTPLRFFSVLLVGFLLSTSPAASQDLQPLIPRLESAESVFDTAIQAFQDGEYEVAARLFGVVANNYDLHQKTTAALLMQGKALYQDMRYEEATDALNELLFTYPNSKYTGEAQSIIDNARGETTTEPQEVLRLGIALPLNEEAATLTQQMFNGIKMAVDEYNRAVELPQDSLMGLAGESTTPSLAGGPAIQMIFRDTRNDVQTTREAIESLIEVEEVHAILGPLFSLEANAAADVAERSRTVLIAPLANDEGVSAGRSYVFQANPTFSMRGRLMARFAMRGLGLDSLGIISEYNASSRLMSAGFRREVEEQGQRLAYFHQIEDPRAWLRLSQEVEVETLREAEGVYIPMTGNNSARLITALLGSLDRMGLNRTAVNTRVLGNVQWHEQPITAQASPHMTTYSNDFYINPDDSSAVAFVDQYDAMYGEKPDRVTISGYDVARFLIERMAEQNLTMRPLHDLIHSAPPFQGIGIRLDFSTGNVNSDLFYHRFRDGRVELLR